MTNERLTEFSRGFMCGMRAATDALEAAINRDFTGSKIATTLLIVLKAATRMACEQIEKGDKVQ